MNIRPLPKHLQEKANKELNEIPDELEGYLKILKAWLSQQDHLVYRNDNQLLVNFLRGSKFSLQRTKQKIDAYYSFRKLVPDIARNMDSHFPAIHRHLKMGVCISLPSPKEDPGAPRVLLCRALQYDPDELSFVLMCKIIIMFCDILLNEDDNFIVSGAVVVWDMNGLKLKTVGGATPAIIKQMASFYDKAFPTRLKGIYVINVPTYAEHMLNMGKLFLSKKLGSRMHFYSSNNWNSIYKDIPRSNFPNELGGTGGSLDKILEDWLNVVEQHHERLLNEDNYYSEESKRPKGDNNGYDMFGVEGSFKALQID